MILHKLFLYPEEQKTVLKETVARTASVRLTRRRVSFKTAIAVTSKVIHTLLDAKTPVRIDIRPFSPKD